MSEEAGSAGWRVGRKSMRLAQILLMLLVAFLLGSHVVKWEAVRVDAITLALLGALLLIPFADLIRKIKLGEFEAEIGREEVAKAQAKVAVEFPSASEAEISALKSASENSFGRILGSHLQKCVLSLKKR